MSGVAENKRMRNRIVKALKPLHAVAVENLTYPGTPDINFAGGWLELKELEAWPKDPDAVVPVPHFTPQQRLFLRLRNKAGEFADVLLKVGRSWFLIYGPDSADNLGKTWSTHAVGCNAYAMWEMGLMEEGLLYVIKEEARARHENPPAIP